MSAISSGSKGAIGETDPPKTYESNFIHHDLVQFGNNISDPIPNKPLVTLELSHCSQYKAVLSFTVLSQQCFEVCFIYLVVEKPL